jgi:Zn-dependent M28 family amino/carboxypeptidase
MGVSTDTQQTSTATNLLGKLNGTDSDKTVLLVAHYDTVANSPGAGDNTSSVAALIETTRALKARGPSKNNIMVLFSDNEEAGLYGAKAFVHSPDLSKDIGIVLNFDARGSSGPSLMFETSSHNEWLIREFSIAAPYPVASSLMYSIYRTLPNDSDFTIFKDAGFPGFNFAFIDGYNVYHTPQDTVERLDERSVQHHGSISQAST